MSNITPKNCLIQAQITLRSRVSTCSVKYHFSTSISLALDIPGRSTALHINGGGSEPVAGHPRVINSSLTCPAKHYNVLSEMNYLTSFWYVKDDVLGQSHFSGQLGV